MEAYYNLVAIQDAQVWIIISLNWHYKFNK